MRSRLLRAVFVVVLLAASTAEAETLSDAKKSEIDLAVGIVMGRHGVPGAALAIGHNGNRAYAKGYGVAKFGVPVGPDTIFPIGSVTKQFTAAGVLLAISEGKKIADGTAFTLDTPIGKVLGGPNPGLRNITVRHLLSHTSGIQDYVSNVCGPEAVKGLGHDDILARIGRGMPPMPTGRFAYSNSNYYLLATMMEGVAETFNALWIRDKILKPLGMSATGPLVDSDDFPGHKKARASHRAQGHFPGGAMAPETHSSMAYGAGNLESTVLDLLKWNNALLKNSLLKKDFQVQMFSTHGVGPGMAPYGFGWYVAGLDGGREMWHAGSICGFSSFNAIFPGDGLSISILTNVQENGRVGLALNVLAGVIANAVRQR